MIIIFNERFRNRASHANSRREEAIKPQAPIWKKKAGIKAPKTRQKPDAAIEMYPPPMVGSADPDEQGRYLARVLSVCPAEEASDGEPQFVVQFETPAKRIRYLVDKRSAIFLAYGLMDQLRLFHSLGSVGTLNADA